MVVQSNSPNVTECLKNRPWMSRSLCAHSVSNAELIDLYSSEQNGNYIIINPDTLITISINERKLRRMLKKGKIHVRPTKRFFYNLDLLKHFVRRTLFGEKYLYNLHINAWWFRKQHFGNSRLRTELHQPWGWFSPVGTPINGGWPPKRSCIGVLVSYPSDIG